MLLLHRAFALGAPRRTWASSITSSWYSVARCTSSMTAPATVTCQCVGIGTQLRGQHGEQRAEALAAGLEQMLDGLGHQLVGFAQLSGHQVLDAGHAVADVLRKGGVPEVHARDHARRCPHPANILGDMNTRRRLTWCVVGAGPAGSAAAAWAARGGRDVLVIDSAAVPPRQGVRRRADPARDRRDAAARASGRGSTAASRHHGLRMSGFGADVEIAVARPVVPGDQQRGAPHRTRRPHPDGRRGRRREDDAGRQSR